MKALLRKPERTWAEVERFDPAWRTRIERMAAYIGQGDASVVDVGCGPMWLRDYIASDVSYTGIDYVARDETTIICDLNRAPVPRIAADVWFVSGCLEYLDDPGRFIDQVSLYARKCIISYCDLDNFPSLEERENRGWRNHLSLHDVASFLHRNDMVSIGSEVLPSGDSIIVFSRA
jgi:hypothetical protein